jgi:hypothetical protein
MKGRTGIISKEDAHAHLEPYFGLIRQPIDLAWADWKSHYSATKHVLTPTAQANVVWSHMWDHVRGTFSNVPHTTVIEEGGIHAVAIDCGTVTFLLRYKKLDIDRMSKNVRTHQSRAFRAQMEIEGLPKSVHIEAGYILNATGTSFESVELVCPKPNGINWCMALPETGALTSPLPLFTGTSVETTRSTVSVKSRRDDAEQKEAQ